jgi:hypothetical protein
VTKVVGVFVRFRAASFNIFRLGNIHGFTLCHHLCLGNELIAIPALDGGHVMFFIIHLLR